ncbi:MAG: O-antigen ligase family protein [Ruminococcaceae bacterium]|nr:O-antigen ligase family protein [Oscillospiraceae bacterium]
MKIWSLRKGKTPMLHYVLLMYWVVLLVWQNLGSGGTENKGSLDLLIKFFLIVVLCVYYFIHATGIRRDVLLLVMALVLMYGVAKIDGALDLGEMLYYFFPLMFILIVYGCGWKFELRREQLVRLCNLLVIVVAYIAIYALIFCFDQFKNAFTITNAYGNELKSFLLSSHEYGLYLIFGIMGAILCMEFDPEGSKKKRIWYICAIVLFGINLILTFSRTSLLAFAVMMLCYVFLFARRSIRMWVSLLVTVLVLTVFAVPSLRDFFWEIVMKENNDAGRESLIDAAMNIYKSGNAAKKLLGYDYTMIKALLARSRQLGSFHNAYMSLLVSNGLVGVAILITTSIVTFKDIYITIKKDTPWSRLPKFFIAFNCASIAIMMFNTTTLLASSIDSYFLTLFVAIVPKYVNRSIREGTFDLPAKEKTFRERRWR